MVKVQRLFAKTNLIMMEKYKILRSLKMMLISERVDSFLLFLSDGYDVTEQGQDGLQEIANGGYDIVFLDSNLPDGTGLNSVKRSS